MTRLGVYDVHPVADVFPLIEGQEFEDLVADVMKHGLAFPIVLSSDESMIIDGRNRYRACLEAGLDPVFEVLPEHYDDAMVVDFIMTRNVRRREMNPGQLAMLATEIEERLAELAVERKREAGRATGRGKKVVVDLPQPFENGRSREQAARLVGASPSAVQHAKAVRAEAPDLVDAVRQGDLALDAAYKDVKERRKRAPEPKPKKAKPTAVVLKLRTHEGEVVDYLAPQGRPTFNESKGEGVSWANWTWNPVTGCLHGCEYCYARELATRASYRAAYPAGFTPLFHEERLEAPLHTRVSPGRDENPAWHRVFVCSMADLYGRWVPREWITLVHDAMLAAPDWEYLLLTKFPSRYAGLQLPPNSWVGTSVDTQRRVNIAEDAFRKIDGVKVKWLSLEPLREPLHFNDLSMFDWVVIGSQTETHQPDGTIPAFAPPFEWVASIVAQAREAGCKIHLKPNLLGSVNAQLPGMQLPDEYPV